MLLGGGVVAVAVGQIQLMRGIADENLAKANLGLGVGNAVVGTGLFIASGLVDDDDARIGLQIFGGMQLAIGVANTVTALVTRAAVDAEPEAEAATTQPLSAYPSTEPSVAPQMWGIQIGGRF